MSPITPPANDVAARLRDDILTGVYPPGDRLPEVQLAQRYEVGRGAVRSALAELNRERLVDRPANRGATVRRVDAAEAIRVIEARAALECLMTAYAARRADDAEQRELKGIVRRMAEMVETDDRDSYSSLSATLHRRICDVARHDVAHHLVVNLQHRSAHHQHRVAVMPGRPAEALQCQQAIVDAIVAGDADAASGAMHDHLHSVIRVLGYWIDLGLGDR